MRTQGSVRRSVGRYTIDVATTWDRPAVILLAHNRKVTYGYTGVEQSVAHYFDFVSGSVVIDPWRTTQPIEGMTVIHYGNTRHRSI